MAVVPLVYGAGIQNKILEAMACGTPVVTTSKTLSSLGVTPGKELVVADGAEGFSQVVLSLLDNPALRSKVGNAGCDHVKSHHSWGVISKQVVGHYEEAKKQAVMGKQDRL
jgi:glycosyltransferase involved in cell wall biosynthesis